MSPADIPRVAVTELSVRRFLTEYVLENKPVVVTGALASWDLRAWTPTLLEQQFGNKRVQVYNTYFDLQTLMPLKQYLAQYFDKPAHGSASPPPYVRWYTQLRDQKFCWADDVFAEMKNQWQLPAFLPNTDYVLPLSEGATTTPVTDPFPAKGLFISPRGARTSLHVDPWGSCAVLCQLHGSKSWYLYAPDQRDYLRNDFGVVDIARPDWEKFPTFAKAQLTSTCILEPGEVIYIPHGWFHQVECNSDSVSLTWNFVHATTVESLVAWLRHPLSEFDQSVLRFFYGLQHSDRIVEDVLARIHTRMAHASAM